MINAPQELIWIFPKKPKSRTTGDYKPYRAYNKNRRYDKPPESVVLDVAKYLGFRDEESVKEVSRHLYVSSWCPRPYFDGSKYRTGLDKSSMSLYKTTWVIYENLDSQQVLKKINRRVKNLHMIFETSIQLLHEYKTFPVDGIPMKKFLSAKFAKKRKSEVREMLRKGKLSGYVKYGYNSWEENRLDRLLNEFGKEVMDGDAFSLYETAFDNKRFRHELDSQKRLDYYGDEFFKSIYPDSQEEYKIMRDVISLYSKLGRPLAKDDIEFVLSRRYGFLLKENETFESIVEKWIPKTKPLKL